MGTITNINYLVTIFFLILKTKSTNSNTSLRSDIKFFIFITWLNGKWLKGLIYVPQNLSSRRCIIHSLVMKIARAILLKGESRVYQWERLCHMSHCHLWTPVPHVTLSPVDACATCHLVTSNLFHDDSAPSSRGPLLLTCLFDKTSLIFVLT